MECSHRLGLFQYSAAFQKGRCFHREAVWLSTRTLHRIPRHCTDWIEAKLASTPRSTSRSASGARTRPGIPDSGQAAKRDSLWVLDIDSRHHNQPSVAASSSVRTHSILARRRAIGDERMQFGGEHKVDDATCEIAALLATAYQRYAKLRLVRTVSVAAALPSTEGLDNTGEPSPHELTLTGRRGHRKESAQE
jgi:hypothetical protein